MLPREPSQQDGRDAAAGVEFPCRHLMLHAPVLVVTPYDTGPRAVLMCVRETVRKVGSGHFLRLRPGGLLLAAYPERISVGGNIM